MRKSQISFQEAVRVAESVEMSEWVHYEPRTICTRTHDNAYRAVFRGQRDDIYISLCRHGDISPFTEWYNLEIVRYKDVNKDVYCYDLANDKYIFMRGDMVLVFDNEPMGKIKKNPQQHRTLRNLFVKIHRQKEGNKPLFRGY